MRVTGKFLTDLYNIEKNRQKKEEKIAATEDSEKIKTIHTKEINKEKKWKIEII